jgi:hypothetical protein
MAAAGTLAAGTGVLTAALLVPAVASAPSSQTSATGGVLKITAGCNQMSAGTLSSVITGTTPGTKFGQLSVGGKATLAGTLKVNTGNDSSRPRAVVLRAAVPHPRRHVRHPVGYSGLHGELHRHGGQRSLPVMDRTKASPGPA